MTYQTLAEKISKQSLSIIEPLKAVVNGKPADEVAIVDAIHRALEAVPGFSTVPDALKTDVRKDVTESIVKAYAALVVPPSPSVQELKAASKKYIPDAIASTMGLPNLPCNDLEQFAKLWMDTFGESPNDPRVSARFKQPQPARSYGSPANNHSANYLLTNRAWELYFEKTQEGFAIGYHVEGGDTFNEAGVGETLSLGSLTDQKLLYLCANPHEWFPYHLKEQENEYRVYKVVFKPPTSLIVSEWQTYFDLNPDLISNRIKDKDRATQLSDLGVNLVIYPGQDDKKELSEAFLMYPRRWVVSIEKAAHIF